VIAGFGASLLVAMGLGWLVVGGLAAGSGQRPLLAGSLVIGIGLGVASMLFIVWSWAIGSPSFYPLAESILMVTLATAALRSRRRSVRSVPVDSDAGAPAAAGLRLTLGVCAVAACIAFVAEVASTPHGGWDAWMTWNMHARAISRGGERWGEVLRALPAWSHPDYPLLIPASVARVWTYQAGESAIAPAAVGFLFTFATVGLLYAGVSALRSPAQGALAALLLVSTKFFILHGASQYADIPLSFFFLATLVLLALGKTASEAPRHPALLAGLAAGLAAWTKNEGLLFIPVVFGVWFLSRPRSPRTSVVLRSAAVGLIPALAVVVGFKIWVAAPNDLLVDQGLAQTFGRVLETDRYGQILGGFVAALLEVSARGVVPIVLAGYLLMVRMAPGAAERRTGRALAAVVVVMLVGYGAVLLVAPASRLGTNIRSINRLLLQLWPSMLFAYFCLVRTPDEARRSARRIRTAPEPA
jgi:hypothetical protein